MELTERQKDILNSLVKTYIKSAEPVSSKALEKKYGLGICPATIRIEMQKLADKGYIFQPHTSAGRMPTDKGYRFFVDSLLEKEFSEKEYDLESESWMRGEFEGAFGLIRSVTKNLSSFSSSLVLSYLVDEKIIWKEGWGEILKEPEFKEKNFIVGFAEFLEEFEKSIDCFGENSAEKQKITNKDNSKIKIYIGKESPFKKANAFSIISSKCCLHDKEEVVVAFLGPKRMDYDKNINSLYSLIRLLENY